MYHTVIPALYISLGHSQVGWVLHNSFLSSLETELLPATFLCSFMIPLFDSRRLLHDRPLPRKTLSNPSGSAPHVVVPGGPSSKSPSSSPSLYSFCNSKRPPSSTPPPQQLSSSLSSDGADDGATNASLGLRGIIHIQRTVTHSCDDLPFTFTNAACDPASSVPNTPGTARTDLGTMLPYSLRCLRVPHHGKRRHLLLPCAVPYVP